MILHIENCPYSKKASILITDEEDKAICDTYQRDFDYDYEVHDELSTSEINYWIIF